MAELALASLAVLCDTAATLFIPITTAMFSTLLADWQSRLQGWALDGSLLAAAQEALLLDGASPALTALLQQWATGDFGELPPIVLLSAADMNGAQGAYGISTGSIYLNGDWLAAASNVQVWAVLTEELGHHLDGLLNAADTPGDEGEYFSRLLLDPVGASSSREVLRQQDDHATLKPATAGALALPVELAVVGGQYTVVSTPIPVASPGRSQHERINASAFAALRSDGSVVTWGDASWGGDSSGIDFNGPDDSLTVTQIFSNNWAFAALRSDGSVVTWGDELSGGDSSGVDFNGPDDSLTVTQLFSTERAFTALRSDGSVVTWGDELSGGDSSGVDFDGSNNNLTVTQVFSNFRSFAALRSDGSVVSWGDSRWGGNSDTVDFNGPLNNLTVSQIFSTEVAYAALRSDGSVVTWGLSSFGGNSNSVDFNGTTNNLTVSQIFSSETAFAALRSDGSVVTWGESSAVGNSSGLDFNGPANNLSVSQMVSSRSAFAALRTDGSVVVWGDALYGGDASNVDFNGAANNLVVTNVFSNYYAFTALLSDGTVVSWGDAVNGGVSSGVNFKGPEKNLSVSQIFASDTAFAALLSDGSVVTWGNTLFGGDSSGVDFNGSNDNLTVKHIFSNQLAFSALRSDGSVVTWGYPEWGGNSVGVDFDGPSDNLSVLAFADPFTDDQLSLIVENAGAVDLQLTGTSRQYSVHSPQLAGASAVPIQFGGNQLYEATFVGVYQLLAAETIDGVNQLLWKHLPSKALHQWTLDGNWNWTGSKGWDDSASSAGQLLEFRYGVDADGNGTVARYVEQAGVVGLLTGGTPGSVVSAVQNQAGASAVSIRFGGAQLSEGIFGADWQLLAAETIDGVNQLLWKHLPSKALHQWSLDGNWTWTGSKGWDDSASSAGQLLEFRYGVDADGNGTVARYVEQAGVVGLLTGGTPGSVVSAVQNQVGASAVSIRFGGAQLSEGIFGADWQLLAAETIDGVNQLLWKHLPSKALHQWTLDGNWTWTGSKGWDDSASSAGQLLEALYGVDADGNGTVARYVEQAGVVGLLTGGTPGSVVSAVQNQVGASAVSIRFGGAQLSEGIFGADWQLLAAETIGGVNQLLWKYIPDNRLHQWTLDSNWTWTGSKGWDDPVSSAGQLLEARYGVDVDGDLLVRAFSDGSTGVDVLTGTSGDTLFAPLGVAAGKPAGTGFDEINSGGGRNQYLVADLIQGGNLYAAAGAADYLRIDGFNSSTDQLLVANAKAYGTTALTIGNISGMALYEDRNTDGFYASATDDLLVLLQGINNLPTSSIVLG